MEIFEILDEQGNPAGRTASRTEAHAAGLWHRTVHVWIASPGGQVLFQRRSLQKESYPGKWDISAAGHIEAGDSSRSAGVREVREEIGLHLTAGDLHYLFTIKGQYHNPQTQFFDNEFSDVYLAVSSFDPSKLVLQKSEVDAVRLIAVDKVMEEIAAAPDLFVPHEEEYRRLIDYFAP